jgi:hypothetical protein
MIAARYLLVTSMSLTHSRIDTVEARGISADAIAQ